MSAVSMARSRTPFIETSQLRRMVDAYGTLVADVVGDAGSAEDMGEDFGCGSSREHAPWALRDYGIRCVIAPSFADIFYSNCFKNGLLPVRLPEEDVRRIMDLAVAQPGSRLNVDLETQRLWTDDEEIFISFDIDPALRHALINGLDDIGLTLQHEDKIAAYEVAHDL